MGMIERKKRLMMHHSTLPSIYHRVEYIYSQEGIIDLNYVPTIKPVAVITMMFILGGDRDIMGFSQNVYPSFIVDAHVGSRWYNRWGGISGSAGNTLPYANEKHTWEFGKIVYLDGVPDYGYTSEVDWSSNTQTFNLLGARNNASGFRVYDFKLYDGDLLIRNLIPCYRKSDNVVGFYDTVSGTFFTSSVGTLSIPT